MPRGTILQTDLLPAAKSLLVRKGFSSPIWRYFGFPTNPADPSEPASEDEIVCALCNKTLSYNKSTTVMHKHLKGRHPSIFETLPVAERKVASRAKVGRPSTRRIPPAAATSSRMRYHESLRQRNMVPKRSSSWVWHYFLFPLDPETNQVTRSFVTCTLCDKRMSYHGGTSPMRTHMRLLHKPEFAGHNQWESVEVSQDVLDLNASDPKVKHEELQSEVEEMNLSSLTDDDIFADDFLQKKGLLGKKGACSSPIWRFFGFLPDPEEPGEAQNPDKAVCGICGKQLLYANSSTTIMRNHLEHKHPKVHRVIASTPRRTGEGSRSSGGSMMANRKKRLSSCIASYLAKDLKPLASLEEPSFRKMLHEFDPRYVLPSREEFSMRVVPRLYEQVKMGTVLPAVKNAKHVALSVDVWGRSSVDQYMAVTAHLLTPEWDLRSYMLENAEFPLPHDAAHIADCLNKVAGDWGIGEEPVKISGLVTDNAVQNSFTGKHVPCLGHTLNAVVRAGLRRPGVAEPIARCTRLVEFLLGSPKLKITVDAAPVAQAAVAAAAAAAASQSEMQEETTNEVDVTQQYETQQQLDVQGQLDVLERLVTAAQIHVEDHADLSTLTSTLQPAEAQAAAAAAAGVPQEESLNVALPDPNVPLGSNHGMLHSVLGKRDLIKTILAASERTELELTDAESRTAEEVEKVLAPLQTLAESFLGRSYVTASGLLPSVYYLKAVLKEKDDDLPEIVEMKRAMEQELSGVYDDPSLSVILPKATFLDARYKKLPFLAEDQKLSLHEEIAKEATALTTSTKLDECLGSDEPPEKKPVMVWASLLNDMFDDGNVGVEESEPIGGAKDEIRRYLTEPRLGLDADPLRWWQQNGPRYPLLSAVAFKYLCIPSTSVPSERLFSSAGVIIAAKRSLLDSRDIQMLPFLSTNLP